MERLLEILEELTSPENLLENLCDVEETEKKKYYSRFEEIYIGDFRHSYSQLSGFLEDRSPDVYTSLRLWVLAIAQYAEQMGPEKPVCKSLKKLLDHIELESIRLERMKEVKMYALRGSQINREMKETADDAKRISNEAMQTAKDARDNLSTYHEKSIGILSIFSAVILAFMGGISFSSGILNSISQASMFRLIMTILLLGFVLCNAIFILLQFVAYIINGKQTEQFRNGVWVFNSVLLLMVVATLVAYIWGYGSYIEEWGSKPVPESSVSTVK